MKYLTLALAFVYTLHAVESSDQAFQVHLENAQTYEITYSAFDGENNNIKNHSMMVPASWNTTITLFFNEGYSGSITYKGELEGEKLVNAIHEFDRSIKSDVQKHNADNHTDLLAKQNKTISQCCAAIILIGLPVLDVIYQYTFGSVL